MKKTSWITVAREGKTLKKDVALTRKLLTALADNYDPVHIYGARIWPEHRTEENFFYASPLGHVLGLKVKDDDRGRAMLQAKMDVNWLGEYFAANDYKAYSSIEIVYNFPEVDGPYLYGIAWTDSPASLGTERIKLSLGSDDELSSDADPSNMLRPGVIIPDQPTAIDVDGFALSESGLVTSDNAFPPNTPLETGNDMKLTEQAKANIFDRLFSSIGSVFSGLPEAGDSANDSQDDGAPDKQDLSTTPAAESSEVKIDVKALATALSTAMIETIESIEPDNPDHDEQGKDKEEQIEQLSSQITALTRQLDQLKTELSATPAGQQRSLATGDESAMLSAF